MGGLVIGVYDKLRIYVGDIPVDCSVQGQEVTVTVEGREYKLSDQERTRILPAVYLSLGEPNMEAQQKFADQQRRIFQKITDKIPLSKSELSFPGKLLPRLVIEAPRDIKILRQKLYDERQADRVPTPSASY